MNKSIISLCFLFFNFCVVQMTAATEGSAAETRLFVIAHHTYNSGYEPPPGSSSLFGEGGYGYYIAPISDPEVIAKAREITRIWKAGGITAVMDSGLGHHVIADIDLTADGVNRDYSEPNAPLWNWHVTDVTEIGVFALTVYGWDGTPWAVENGDAGLYGQIAFSDYLPIGELPFSYDPEQSGAMRNAWIGDFSDAAYPWIYHKDLGWMWVSGFDPNHVWMYWHDRQNWLWTSESIFPWFYDRADSAWKYYVQVENEPDWFYNLNTDAWEYGVNN